MTIGKLFNRNMVLLFQGQLVKQTGATIFRVGSVLWLQQETHLPYMAGLFYVALTLPISFLGPIGGVLVDSVSRKNIIVFGDFVIASLTLLSFLVMNYFSGNGLIVLLIFISATSIGIVESVFRPAISTSVLDLTPAVKAERVYSLQQSCEKISLLVGFTLGGMLYGILGIKLVVLIIGLSYLLSGVVGSFIVFPQASVGERVNVWNNIAAIKVDMLKGFNYVIYKKGLITLFLAAAMAPFLSSLFSVLLPFFIENTLRYPAEWYGFLLAGFILGMIFGGLIAGGIKVIAIYKSKVVVIGIVLMSVNLIVVSCTDNIGLVFFTLIISGSCMGLNGVLIISAVQGVTPKEIYGRVLGLYIALMYIITPFSMGFTGIIAHLFNNNVVVVFFTYGVLGLLICPFLIFGKEFHQLMQSQEGRA